MFFQKLPKKEVAAVFTLIQVVPKVTSYFCHYSKIFFTKIFKNSPIWSHCSLSINGNSFWGNQTVSFYLQKSNNLFSNNRLFTFFN